MVQWSNNTTGGIASWRTTAEPFLIGDERPYEPGQGLRYACGSPVPGMELQPDYNNPPAPGKERRCRVCGELAVPEVKRGLLCKVHFLEWQRAKSRERTIKARLARAICAD